MKKERVLEFIFKIYMNWTEESEISYEDVDDFYGYVGYDLEEEKLLNELDIHSTRDLVEALELAQSKL